MRALLIAALCALSAPVFAQASRPANPHKAKKTAGMTFSPQPGWKAEPPSNSMRKAQFLLPATEGGADVRVVVYHFGKGQGGGATDNLERWRKQLRAGKDAPKPVYRTWIQHDSVVHTIDAKGSFSPMARPGAPKAAAIPDARLLGAVIERKGGPYFVKLVGPSADVTRWEKSYANFLATLDAGRPRAVTFSAPAWTAIAPSSRMRAGEFQILGRGPALHVVIYHFGKGKGGDVEANFKRWIAQFTQPDGSASADRAKRGTFKSGAFTIHTLELTGTYVAETRPGSGERVNHKDYALRAAVVEGADGPYFVKLVDRAKLVAGQAERFATFLKQGIRPLKVSKSF